MKHLLDLLGKGTDASWLPRRQAKSRGNGGLAQDFDRMEQNSIEYIYLPFQPNGINYCSLGTLDVISYNFTGCIMAAFATGDGWFVCHVSTGSDQNCRPYWDSFKMKVSSVWEFKPSRYYPSTPGAHAIVGMYGLITPGRECYAILVAHDGGRPYVAEVNKCERELEQAPMPSDRSSALTAPLAYPQKAFTKAATRI